MHMICTSGLHLSLSHTHPSISMTCSAGEMTVQGRECVVCLNKNYTNKRTKFKITASLQKDTSQVMGTGMGLSSVGGTGWGVLVSVGC